MEASTESREREWDSLDEIWDDGGIHSWGVFYHNPQIDMLVGSPATDSRVIRYWQNHKGLLTQSKRLPGFYTYIGACLWLDEIHGPAALRSTLRWTPEQFSVALQDYLPGEGAT